MFSCRAFFGIFNNFSLFIETAEKVSEPMVYYILKNKADEPINLKKIKRVFLAAIAFFSLIGGSVVVVGISRVVKQEDALKKLLD